MRSSEDWLTDEDTAVAPAHDGDQRTVIRGGALAKACVYVHAESPPPDPSRLPYLLNDAFCRWLKLNPNVTIRAVLPIVSGGNPVAIHALFE